MKDWELTPEDIDDIKPTLAECKLINTAAESYKPKEFKGLFYNDEVKRLVNQKLATAAAVKVIEWIDENTSRKRPRVDHLGFNSTTLQRLKAWAKEQKGK